MPDAAPNDLQKFEPVKEQTRLIYPEQLAFLDGTGGMESTASREHGTAAHLDRLRNHLRLLHEWRASEAKVQAQR
jgi:hypothetical protein